jgi:hypothetical protein
MKLIGYWIESLADTDFVPPQELIGAWDPATRAAVVTYLDGGEVYESYRGYSLCRFCRRENGDREFSDGAYVWPQGLSHYVRDHSVRLPEEFVQHVLNGPGIIPRAQWDDSRADPTFWRLWCQSHANGALRSRIETAKIIAASQAQQELQNRADQIQAESGLSAKPCINADCGNRAMKDRAFCAACTARNQFSDSIRRERDSANFWLALQS